MDIPNKALKIRNPITQNEDKGSSPSPELEILRSNASYLGTIAELTHSKDEGGSSFEESRRRDMKAKNKRLANGVIKCFQVEQMT